MKIFKQKNKQLLLMVIFLVGSFYFVRKTNANDSTTTPIIEAVETDQTQSDEAIPLLTENPTENTVNQTQENPPVETSAESENNPANTPEPTQVTVPANEPIPEVAIPAEEPKEQEIEYIYTPPANLPKISVEPKEINIKVDPTAKHACNIDGFNTDMTSVTGIEKRILLSGSVSSPKDIEVVGLPQGFNIKFTKNNQTKVSVSSETSINIKIEKTLLAQRGSFNVSFIFTEKGAKNSSVICQMNLVNR